MILLSVVASGCAKGEVGEGATDSSARTSASDDVSCAELWDEVYEAGIASGVSEGEAFRLADSARAGCEGLGDTVPSIAPGPDVPCAHEDGGDAKQLEDTKFVIVYFSCEADFAVVGTPAQPLYAFEREIPASSTDSVEERLEAAVRAYLTGPTPDEIDRGYFSAGARSLADTLDGVTLADGLATIGFSPELGAHLGNIGTSTATLVLLSELQATVFQFRTVKSLSIEIEGDCEAFWRALEIGGCRTIERPGAEGGVMPRWTWRRSADGGYDPFDD